MSILKATDDLAYALEDTARELYDLDDLADELVAAVGSVEGVDPKDDDDKARRVRLARLAVVQWKLSTPRERSARRRRRALQLYRSGGLID